jgi:hypothetical protein
VPQVFIGGKFIGGCDGELPAHWLLYHGCRHRCTCSRTTCCSSLVQHHKHNTHSVTWCMRRCREGVVLHVAVGRLLGGPTIETACRAAGHMPHIIARVSCVCRHHAGLRCRGAQDSASRRGVQYLS